MGLLSKLEKPAPRNRTCAVQRIIESLPTEEAQALKTALERIKNKESGHTVGWLVRVLASEQISISDMSLYRHVGERCGCGAE